MISVFTIFGACYLLITSLYKPLSSGNRKILCGNSIKKMMITKISECTLIVQICSIVFYLLSSLLLGMATVMYVSNKQMEETISYSFFFASVAFAGHLMAAMFQSADFFVCAHLNNRSQKQHQQKHPGINLNNLIDFSSLEGSSNCSTNGDIIPNFSNFSTLGIGGFKPITTNGLAKAMNNSGVGNNPPPQPPVVINTDPNGSGPVPSQQHHHRDSQNQQQPSQHQEQTTQQQQQYEPPSFITCMRYHD